VSDGTEPDLQWGFFLSTRNVPEIKTEPARIAFHLVGEFLASVGLIVGGIALLRSATWAETVYLVAAGMVIYSEIVSPGYFAQKKQWALVGMFVALLALAVVSVVLLARSV
jgi:hypothetical protein